MRSEGTAHKIRKRRSVLYKIMDKLFYMMRGIRALYEWCVPASTSHFSLLTITRSSLYLVYMKTQYQSLIPAFPFILSTTIQFNYFLYMTYSQPEQGVV